MEIATLPPNTIVPEVLEENNYERWSILIKHYLVAQGVWDAVERYPTIEERNDGVWIKKNALALHAIKISCGAKAFDLIKNIESARDAWQALQKKQNVPDGHYFPRRHEFVPRDMATRSEREQLSILHESICKGSKRRVERAVDCLLNIRADRNILKPALHAAITAGQEDIACFLYRRTPLKFLRRDYGFILLEECVTKKMFKIAWDLLHRFPHWATKEPSEGYMPIILTVAKTPPPFYRRSQLKFVRLWIYRCIEVNVELIKPSDAADDASGERSCCRSCLQFLKALRRKPVTTLLKILGKLVTPLLKILGKQPRLRKINY